MSESKQCQLLKSRPSVDRLALTFSCFCKSQNCKIGSKKCHFRRFSQSFKSITNIGDSTSSRLGLVIDLPHVTWYYKLILTAGHHRQPRNTSSEEDLAPSGGGDILPGGSVTPTFFSQLPCPTDSSASAKLIFWSVTDGTSGQVLPPSPLTQTVGNSPMTITAWYICTGGGGPGSTVIIDDAFSANLGQFIDDTFVDVTSDPSLTNDANVVGIVPTSQAETLQAYSSVVSTTEPFSKWILNGTFMPAGNRILNASKGAVGIAIAVYQSPPSTGRGIPPSVWQYNPWWWITSWWGHGPDPGPELTREFRVAVELVATANEASPQIRARILQTALEQTNIIASTLEKQIRDLQRSQR